MFLACVLALTSFQDPMMLPHGIPDFGANPTIATVQDGSLTDPATWGGRLPNANDVARVKHSVSLCDGELTAKVLAIEGVYRQCSRLRVATFLVYHNGSVEFEPGSETIIRDVPTDDTTDPLEWGTSVICLGKFRAAGTIKTPFVRLNRSIPVGSVEISMDQVPADWLVGDRIAIPDTHQVVNHDLAADMLDQGETFQIAAKTANTITLNKPTVYSHMAARNADGVEELFPHVVNLTRDIVFRSENPAGTRGHMVFTHRADVIGRGVLVKDFGRTTIDKLDSTTVDPHTGEIIHKGLNQIGRYGGPHFHHCYGPVFDGRPYQFEWTDGAVDGGDIAHRRKWGIVVHQSHYGLVARNVCWSTPGAGLTTEDGNEFANIFEGNFVGKTDGGGGDTSSAGEAPKTGSSGDGIWLHGPWSRIRNNVVAGAKRNGIAWFNSPTATGKRPTAPGQDPSQYITQDLVWVDGFSEIDGNEVYAIKHSGILIWKTRPGGATPTITNSNLWHIHATGTNHYFGPGQLVVDGWLHLNDPAKLGPNPVRHGTGYLVSFVFAGGQADTLTIRNARVENVTFGLWSRGRNEARIVDVRNSSFRCAANVEVTTFNNLVHLTFTDCTFGNPFGRTAFDFSMDWAALENPLGHMATKIVNYNGDGQSYDVYFKQQAPDFIIPSTKWIASKYWGLTNAQAWATDGVAICGEIARCLTTNPRVRDGFLCEVGE